MQAMRKLFLVVIGLVILVHSMSLYALPVSVETPVDQNDIEMTQELPGDQEQLYAYDALMPSVQIAQAAVLFYLREVVVEQEPVIHHHWAPETIANRYLDLLFPRIISPNAP